LLRPCNNYGNRNIGDLPITVRFSPYRYHIGDIPPPVGGGGRSKRRPYGVYRYISTPR